MSQLIVCGVMMRLCVETTVRNAFVRRYEVVVVHDACWDKDERYHFASLKNLAHGFAIISTTGEVVCELES